jgi:hypothetical protein
MRGAIRRGNKSAMGIAGVRINTDPIRCTMLIAILLSFAPALAETRQRPGGGERRFEPYVFESVPDISSSASEFVSIPDRWRQFYVGKWYDPYNQNVLKGDIPVFGSPGHEWFIELGLISDTLVERRRVPVPVGFAQTGRSGKNDTFGNGHQTLFNQNIIPALSLIRGNTTFKPPEFEFRFIPVFNFNSVNGSEPGVLRADPARGSDRNESLIAVQELFVDIHLADISDRYDFISSRLGVQRFSSDFRGFVYADDQPGVRFFGTAENNQLQYNLAWFNRLDKDVNSGLNRSFEERGEQVVLGNLYWQDLIALGHTVQGSVIHRLDNAGSRGFVYDDNGFLARPAAIGDERTKNLNTTYLGFNTDGHFDRVNVTSSIYYVFGSESHNAIAGRATDISAGMAALELSYDIDWIRVRSSLFWGSGDRNPFDSRASGFDSIYDNPNFAGGDLSYFQRSNLPFIGGGGVNLVNRFSLLPNLRGSKERGQSNFVNPGIRMLNVGADFEVLPELKLITNASYLQFDETAVLETLRQDGSISREIGFDLSAGILYRPFLNNNILLRFGAGTLLPADGVKNLFGDRVLFDMFSNVILAY